MAWVIRSGARTASIFCGSSCHTLGPRAEPTAARFPSEETPRRPQRRHPPRLMPRRRPMRIADRGLGQGTVSEAMR